MIVLSQKSPHIHLRAAVFLHAPRVSDLRMTEADSHPHIVIIRDIQKRFDVRHHIQHIQTIAHHDRSKSVGAAKELEIGARYIGVLSPTALSAPPMEMMLPGHTLTQRPQPVHLPVSIFNSAIFVMFASFSPTLCRQDTLFLLFLNAASALFYQSLHELIPRTVNDVFRRVILLYLSFIKDEHPGTRIKGFRYVVGDEDDSDAGLPVDLLDLRLELGPGDTVHGSEGFVHQQYLRRSGQRSGDTYPLLLSSGKLGRVTAAHILFQSHCPEPFADCGASLRLVTPIEQFRYISYIFLYGHVWKQHAALYAIAYPPPQRDQIRLRNILSIHFLSSSNF